MLLSGGASAGASDGRDRGSGTEPLEATAATA
jgi:hypothetical protein